VHSNWLLSNRHIYIVQVPSHNILSGNVHLGQDALGGEYGLDNEISDKQDDHNE